MNNDWLRDRLRSLRSRDKQVKEQAQAEINQKYWNRLHHRAWDLMTDEHLGADAANEGLRRFFTSPPRQDDNPEGYLWVCLTTAAYRIHSRRTYTAHLDIAQIAVGQPAKVTVFDHGLTGHEKSIKISKTNCCPAIDGKYKEFHVVDKDTFTVPVSVSGPGTKGRLHVRRRKPERRPPGADRGHADGETSWEPHSAWNELDDVERKELSAELQWAVDQLDDGSRALVTAFYLDNKPSKVSKTSIAKKLGVHPGTVTYRLKRAMQQLRRIILNPPSDNPD